MKGPEGYPKEDWLALSGIQHFSFCKRQWALIHIEQLWSENYLTTAGHLEHERAHDYAASESRGDTLIMRDLRVYSRALGITGACDVVEFHKSNDGVPLHGRDGLWLPYPIEYKHGKSKRLMLIVYSYARKRCAWKRCSRVIFLKVLCSIGRQNVVSG